MVTEFCNIRTTNTTGTLVQNGRSKLITATPGIVRVNCNAAQSTLSVSVDTVTAPLGAPAPTPFLSSGTRQYSNILPVGTSTYQVTGNVDNATAGINASFDAGRRSLPAGTYTVKLIPTLVAR
jgi:hypothetical protein